MMIIFNTRLNWWKRRAYSDAILFYLETLGVTRKEMADRTIELIVSRKIAKGGYEGYVQGDDDDDTLEVFVQANDRLLQNLAHEIVHVKQLLTGQLIYNTRGAPLWEGLPWRPTKKDHAYFDAPWEIDAYGREVGLAMRWYQTRSWTKRVLDRMFGVC